MASLTWTSTELTSHTEMELQVSLVVALLMSSSLAVARKDCQLVRSSTDRGQCFSEPECEDVCRTVEDRQCQTTTQQVTTPACLLWDRLTSVITRRNAAQSMNRSATLSMRTNAAQVIEGSCFTSFEISLCHHANPSLFK